jgi:hypothetical protein
MLLLTSHLSRINEPGSARFAAERILPDEFVHRAGIVRWWHGHGGASLHGAKITGQACGPAQQGA